jgi:hypothetical protein
LTSAVSGSPFINARKHRQHLRFIADIRRTANALPPAAIMVSPRLRGLNVVMIIHRHGIAFRASSSAVAFLFPGWRQSPVQLPSYSPNKKAGQRALPGL